MYSYIYIYIHMLGPVSSASEPVCVGFDQAFGMAYSPRLLGRRGSRARLPHPKPAAVVAQWPTGRMPR